MTYLSIFAFILIITSLAFALFYMTRGRTNDLSNQKQMAKALTYRIAISITLFVFVLIAWSFGWIQPTGIRM